MQRPTAQIDDSAYAPSLASLPSRVAAPTFLLVYSWAFGNLIVVAFGAVTVITYQPHDAAFVWCAAAVNVGVAVVARLTGRSARRTGGVVAARIHLLAGIILGGVGLVGQVLLMPILLGG